MIRLFIFAGQSNMTGFGDVSLLSTERKALPTNVRLYEDGEWRELLWKDSFGPELSFSQSVSLAFPDDLIVICKVSKVGANLYYDWNPDCKSEGSEDDYRGPLYATLCSSIENVMSELESETDKCICSGFFWMQGERDAVFDFMAESYKSNLLSFISIFRAYIGVKELPFIIAKIAPRLYLVDEERFAHPFRTLVQNKQDEIVNESEQVQVVETNDLPQIIDNLHFDTGGQLELGKRFANTYLSCLAR